MEGLKGGVFYKSQSVKLDEQFKAKITKNFVKTLQSSQGSLYKELIIYIEYIAHGFVTDINDSRLFGQ